MTCAEVVRALELKRTVLYSKKGTQDWKETKLSDSGFSLDFRKYDYKLKGEGNKTQN